MAANVCLPPEGTLEGTYHWVFSERDGFRVWRWYPFGDGPARGQWETGAAYGWVRFDQTHFRWVKVAETPDEGSGDQTRSLQPDEYEWEAIYSHHREKQWEHANREEYDDAAHHKRRADEVRAMLDAKKAPR